MPLSPNHVNPPVGVNHLRRPYAEGELCEDALYGAHRTERTLRFEAAHHRQMVDLKAAGYNNREIAAITGFHPNTVYHTVQQPWAQNRIVKKIEQNTMGEIRHLIETGAKDAIVRVVEMAGDENLKFKHPKLYAELNESLLDRYLGKAPQVVENRSAPSEMTDEEQDRRLAELREKAALANPD